MTQKVVFITTTGTGTYTIPNDFGGLISVEAIGGGGNGAGGSSNAGGGGGAYAYSNAVTGLTPGTTTYYRVGVGGGTTGTNGTNRSWFNTSNAEPASSSQGVLAEGGASAVTTTGGAGGAGSGTSIGTLVYSGGSSPNGNNGKTGGGGAAGPGGAGGTGGASSTVTGYGGSSGGGAGGAGTTSGNPGTAVAGGNGGNGPLGTGGGAGATTTNAGTAGTTGTGGGGGGGGPTSGNGGSGATYNYWTQTSNNVTAGPGGGGGAGQQGPGTGGSGGLYGGGGGGGVSGTAAGAQGIIVFTYNSLIPYQPRTGFNTTDPNTNTTQDLGSRYITKDYLLDVYPNIASATGNRTAPGLWAAGTFSDDGSVYRGLYPTGGLYYSSPVQIGSLTTWKQISSNWVNASGLDTSGRMWTWGSGIFGSLGNGLTLDYSSPVQVGALTTWKQVSTGVSHMAAVKNDGTLWSWGNNDNGQLGDNTVVRKSSPVQVGASTTNWKQVAAGYFCTFATRQDGSLWGWGNNSIGQLGNGGRSASTYYSSPIQVGSLTNWKQVSTGVGSGVINYPMITAAVKTDGTLWTWGGSLQGALGQGTTQYLSSPVQVGSLTNWKQVTCGWNTMFAIKTDGTLWSWGANFYGQLGQGFSSTTVYYSSPIQVGSLTNWKFINSTKDFCAAIKTDGTLWAWGKNGYGQLGINALGTAYYSSPIQVGSLTTWKSVVTGYNNILAIQDGYI